MWSCWRHGFEALQCDIAGYIFHRFKVTCVIDVMHSFGPFPADEFHFLRKWLELQCLDHQIVSSLHLLEGRIGYLISFPSNQTHPPICGMSHICLPLTWGGSLSRLLFGHDQAYAVELGRQYIPWLKFRLLILTVPPQFACSPNHVQLLSRLLVHGLRAYFLWVSAMVR